MNTQQKPGIARGVSASGFQPPAHLPVPCLVPQTKERLLKLPEVMSRTALGKSSIYALMAAKQFPASVRIGPRCVAWRESSIDAWIQARIDLQVEQEALS